ncbi:hypothetical protein BX070DRAFT_228696 [Coemansia spiralis]|nr:hypothetical protein BX070DRAFT_228696 [Coemansia spiralis]
MREWAGLGNQGREWLAATSNSSVSSNGVNAGPLPVASIPGLKKFSITIFIICAALSLLVFLYGLLVVKLQPKIWRNPIVRVIIVAQLINCLRFIFRPIASFVPMHADTGCRIILFLNNSFAQLPANLCIYCVVYLQIVVIHNVTPRKQWPQAMLMTLAVLISVVPASAFFTFHLPNRHQFILHVALNFQPQLYVFFILSTAMWGYLSGVVGVISVTIIGIYILRAQKKTQHILHMSTDTYGPSRLVVRQSKSDALHHTLVTIIWYPITPIISLWLNIFLSSVAYYTHKRYPVPEYISVGLLGLQSVFLGIALIVNPAIRDVYTEQIKKRFKAARRKSSNAGQPLQPAPTTATSNTTRYTLRLSSSISSL